VIVLDASAAVELLLHTASGAAIAARVASPAESLHAPHLLAVEVAAAMRRIAATSAISASRARAALTDIADLDVARYSHEELLPRVWELRGRVTAYDAVYVALATVLGAPLLTADARLARAVRDLVDVELISAG
jgi:predicted nucleic acid-binding protein